MLNKLWSAVDGRKTYILSALGIIVSLVGHFTGGTTVVGIQIPAFSWDDVWKTVYQSGLISALRHGVGGPTA